MTARSRRLGPFAMLLILVVGLLYVNVSPAFAHHPLETSSPAADETVSTELTDVTLTFTNAPLEGVPSVIQVTDPGGDAVTTGEVTPSDRSLSVTVAPTMTGTYQVTWQTVSSDAHTISDQFSFIYAGPIPSATPSPSTEPSSPSTEPSSPSASAELAPSPSDVTTDAQPENPNSAFLPLIIGVLVIVFVAIAAALIRAFRSRKTQQDG